MKYVNMKYVKACIIFFPFQQNMSPILVATTGVEWVAIQEQWDLNVDSSTKRRK